MDTRTWSVSLWVCSVVSGWVHYTSGGGAVCRVCSTSAQVSVPAAWTGAAKLSSKQATIARERKRKMGCFLIGFELLIVCIYREGAAGLYCSGDSRL